MRRLFAIVAALSLLLCVTTAVLWVRSYWVEDEIQRTGCLRSIAGHIDILWLTWKSTRELDEHGEFREPTNEVAGGGIRYRRLKRDGSGVSPFLMRLNAIGFGMRNGGGNYIQDNAYFESCWRSIVIPDWFLVAITAGLPLARAISRWRNRRLPGHCPACSYNLTGNVSGVCPECGAATVKSVPANVQPGRT